MPDIDVFPTGGFGSGQLNAFPNPPNWQRVVAIDSEYVYTAGDPREDIYDSANFATIPDNATVVNIRVSYQFRAQVPMYNANIKPVLFTAWDDSSHFGAQNTTNSTSWVDGYCDFSPATYGWTTANVKALRLGVWLSSDSGDPAISYCGYVHGVVTYTLPGGAVRRRGGVVNF